MVKLSNSATHNLQSDTLVAAQEQAWPAAIFDPLLEVDREKIFVIGQIGQTIDGRIATVTGQSKYINGPSGLLHLHRLRAVVDAVVVGIGTVIADDPQLTVRLAKGANPARIIIDPNHRLAFSPKIFNDDGARRVVITKLGTDYPAPKGIEIVYLPTENGTISPAAILQSLACAGFSRILIEGGADTVSRFMQAGCLDRLHVIVAPIIMGSGRAGFCLPAIEHMDQAQRLVVHSHKLDDELLFDCDLSACVQRKKD